jgi:hypothetical protein
MSDPSLMTPHQNLYIVIQSPIFKNSFFYSTMSDRHSTKTQHYTKTNRQLLLQSLYCSTWKLLSWAQTNSGQQCQIMMFVRKCSWYMSPPENVLFQDHPDDNSSSSLIRQVLLKVKLVWALEKKCVAKCHMNKSSVYCYSRYPLTWHQHTQTAAILSNVLGYQTVPIPT